MFIIPIGIIDTLSMISSMIARGMKDEQARTD